jgi:RNA polymerase sigma-70 factor (ECF subfamily)
VQRTLVEAAKAGDHDAFEVLVTAAADRLYAIACLILRDRDQAADAFQETLVKAWRQLPTLRDDDRFDAWIRKLLVNACADVGRSQRRWTAEIRVLQVEPFMNDESVRYADRDLIERAFRRLTPDQRVVAVLHYYEDLSHGEIADIVGIPTGTAKSRLHYATEALRAAIAADARAPHASNGQSA